MSTTELPCDTGLPKAEFKDTPVPVQFAQAGITLLGLFLA